MEKTHRDFKVSAIYVANTTSQLPKIEWSITAPGASRPYVSGINRIGKSQSVEETINTLCEHVDIQIDIERAKLMEAICFIEQGD